MKVTTEAAALVDAVQKAARVAPTKGEAFDKAAGVAFDVTNGELFVVATDLQTTYRQKVTTLEAEAEGMWRLPSTVLGPFMGQLPIGAGSQITMTEEDGKVAITCGKTRATFHQFAGDSFPFVGAFDEEDMTPVDGLPGKISQVAWATAKDVGVFTGIHIDGDKLVACDRSVLAEAICAVPVDEPITVPLTSVAPAIKNAGDVRLRAHEGRLHLVPDVDTQITCNIYAEQYPNIQPLRDRAEDLELRVHVSAEQLAEVLNRGMTLCRGERYPLVKLTVGAGFIQLDMDIPDLGTVAEEISIIGGPPEPLTIHFTPTNIISALSSTSKDDVELRLGDPLDPMFIDDGTGITALVMPRKVAGA